MISAEGSRRYHWECQATADHSLLLRLFDYDSQIALDQDGKVTENKLRVVFPHTAVLYLRSNPSTEDFMTVEIVTSGGQVSYQVPVIKMQSYALEQLFEKNLLLLLPFYIFNREKELPECDVDQDKRKRLREEFFYIRRHLELLAEKKEITEYQKRAIIEMTAKVITNLTSKYQRVSREVGGVMRGKTLEYEAKTILREGIQEGIQRGISQGMDVGRCQVILSQIVRKVQKGKSLQKIAEELEYEEEELQPYYEAVQAEAPDYDMEKMMKRLPESKMPV